MYSDINLEAIPPPSQFRRPWSPDPYDPVPRAFNSRTNLSQTHPSNTINPRDNNEHGYSSPAAQQWQGRREASDVSIDALDLADYARTLRTRQQIDPHPISMSSEPHHPPSSYTPRSHYYPSVESLHQVPSLLSRGTTLSSADTLSTSRRNPSHRPFSLPTISHPSNIVSPRSRRTPYIVEPELNNSGIDLSQFPAWSRGWYNDSRPAGLMQDYDTNMYNAIPNSQLGGSKQKQPSPFDPGYVHPSYPEFSDPYGSSHNGHDSLPWGNEPPDYSSQPVDPLTKEQRIRMLEREFGKNAKPKGDVDDFLDDEGKPLIGTVDKKGNLVTQGPIKRNMMRVLQILLATGAAVPSIYAALIIKPNPPAPPASTPQAFVLYIFSVITLLLLLYLFLFRPCFCGQKRQDKSSYTNPLSNGMMVLPVPALNGGKNAKKGKKGNKGGAGGETGDVQINLIVDPAAFNPSGEDDSSSESDDGGLPVPGGYHPGGLTKKHKRKQARRRSVFAGLAMEEEWKRARSWTKKIAFVDAFGILLWGAAFIYILIGKRCPSGGFEGWCNAYNVSTACACLLCVTFGVSTFFDVKDLSTSKVSPRTR